MIWSELIGEHLEGVRRAGRWREVNTLCGGPTDVEVTATGERVVSFASNDYLGLSAHPAVRRGAKDAVDRWGAGSGSARLIVGGRPVHDDLETELAAWKGTEAALSFPTGYQTNVGVLVALCRAASQLRPVIISDELNHASIIDGARLARAEVRVVPHADVTAFDAAAAAARRGGRPAVVVSDSVFSMDGDAADVGSLVEVCRRHEAALVLDEAHMLWGPEPSAADDVVVARVGTLSKALGALGGFVAGSNALIDLCRNVARSFIFTTAASPADAGAALAALRIVRSEEGASLVERVRAHTHRLAPEHPSAVVAVVVGEEDAALAASARLRELGILVPAIRPPTVAPGTSRLRVTFSAAHTDEQVDRLIGGLGALGLAARPS